MKNVCVITGGGSGMGYATAEMLGDKYILVLVGRNQQKLDLAESNLKEKGYEVATFACDISDKRSVKELARFSSGLGKVTAVIHSAGMSPHMGNAQSIMEANALGTINICNSFYHVMDSGCIINVSSMSAYISPSVIMPKANYKFYYDRELLVKKLMSRVNVFPKKVRSGVAYGISKNFVIWYSKVISERFGGKGIRVVSVTPGNFETPMGELEKEEAEKFIEYNGIKRMGQVEEIAYLFTTIIDERNSYLTGTDIICDGGCVAGYTK